MEVANYNSFKFLEDVHFVFIQPYADGFDHLSAGISLKPNYVAQSVFKSINNPLLKRIIHIVTGIALLIPIVNIITTIALDYFSETGSKKSSDLFDIHLDFFPDRNNDDKSKLLLPPKPPRFEIIDVPGDGDCLFHSVIEGITRLFPNDCPFKNINATELRAKCSDKMMELYNKNIEFKANLDGNITNLKDDYDYSISWKETLKQKLKDAENTFIKVNFDWKPIKIQFKERIKKSEHKKAIKIELFENTENPIKCNFLEKSDRNENIKKLSDRIYSVERTISLHHYQSYLNYGITDSISYINVSRTNISIWGEQYHIQALSELLNCSIEVHYDDEDKDHKPTISPMPKSPYPPIKLLNKGNLHYVYIEKINL